MRIILACLVLLLSGCQTVYTISRTDPETGAVTSVSVKSFREFPGGVTIKYNREAGTFDFEAGEVRTATSPIETAAAQLLLQMPGLMEK